MKTLETPTAPAQPVARSLKAGDKVRLKSTEQPNPNRPGKILRLLPYDQVEVQFRHRSNGQKDGEEGRITTSGFHGLSELERID